MPSGEGSSPIDSLKVETPGAIAKRAQLHFTLYQQGAQYKCAHAMRRIPSWSKRC